MPWCAKDTTYQLLVAYISHWHMEKLVLSSSVTLWKLKEIHQSEAKKKQGPFPTGFGDKDLGVKQKEPTGPDQDPVDQNQIGDAESKNLRGLGIRRTMKHCSRLHGASWSSCTHQKKTHTDLSTTL